MNPSPTTHTDLRAELVTRILRSRHFQRAPQLREFLQYVTSRALKDDAAPITEQEVGSQVLRRGQSFDPNEDNIVRVQARHLRQKLADYFAAEGAEEPLILTIPRGSYLPVWEPRPAPPELSAVPKPPAPTAAAPDRFWRNLALAFALTCLLLLAFSATLWFKHQAAGSSPTAGLSPEISYPWQTVFQPGKPTQIVLPDNSIGVVKDLLKIHLTLAQYLNPQHLRDIIAAVPERRFAEALDSLSNRQYTSLAAANMAAHLHHIGKLAGANVQIRYARHVNIHDFRSDNFILLTPFPYAELFAHHLNFAMESDRAEQRYLFRNLRPLPGESEIYATSGHSPTAQVNYATISLVPNLSGAGKVLIIRGPNSEACEAAGELATSREFPSRLAKLLNYPPNSSSPWFEILIRSEATAGSPTGSKIIAHRIIKP